MNTSKSINERIEKLRSTIDLIKFEIKLCEMKNKEFTNLAVKNMRPSNGMCSINDMRLTYLYSTLTSYTNELSELLKIKRCV